MQQLLKILNELHPETEITEETKLIDDKILDSLDIVALVTDINDGYGINIGAADVVKENFNTLSSLSSLIQRYGGKICG